MKTPSRWIRVGGREDVKQGVGLGEFQWPDSVGMLPPGLIGSVPRGGRTILIKQEMLKDTLKGGDSVQRLISPHYSLATGPTSAP